MKRIGLIGWFGAHNIGDELALHVVREGLQERLRCEVDVFSAARSLSAKPCGVISLHEQPGRCFWAQYDAVCWGPGGMLPGAVTLLQDHLPPADMPQVIVSSAWVREGPVRSLLERCRLAWSRSTLLMKPGNLPIIVAPDCVYGLSRVAAAKPEGNRTILICPSARCPEEGMDRIRALVQQAQADQYEVLFYPAAASPGDMDILICKQLADETGAPCLQDAPNWVEALDMIRRARLVVTFRKHPAIMAQLLGVPSVVCDYWGVFRPMQEVADGDSLILGKAGSVGAQAKWLAALNHRSVSLDREHVRQRVNAALDAVAEALR